MERCHFNCEHLSFDTGESGRKLGGTKTVSDRLIKCNENGPVLREMQNKD